LVIHSGGKAAIWKDRRRTYLGGQKFLTEDNEENQGVLPKQRGYSLPSFASVLIYFSQTIRGGILPTGIHLFEPESAILSSEERACLARAAAPQARNKEYVLPSALLFPEGKQERDYAQRGQHCRDGESRRRDFGARMKTLFESCSHADQKEQKRQIDQN
jgi:hypothetical protein